MHCGFCDNDVPLSSIAAEVAGRRGNYPVFICWDCVALLALFDITSYCDAMDDQCDLCKEYARGVLTLSFEQKLFSMCRRCAGELAKTASPSTALRARLARAEQSVKNEPTELERHLEEQAFERAREDLLRMKAELEG